MAATSHDEVRLEEVAEQTYALLGRDGAANAAFAFGRTGVLPFDTQASPRLGAVSAELISSCTDRRVLFVANSHIHGDHTFGNQAFTAAALGHEAMRAEWEEIAGQSSSGRLLDVTERYRLYFGDFHWQLARKGVAEAVAVGPRVEAPDLDAVVSHPPLLTFGDRMAVDLGGRDIELLHLGVAHTRGDIAGWLSRERVLFASDLVVVDRVPLVTDPTTAGWITVIDRLAGLPLDRIVPGHGGVCGRDGLAFTRGYLAALREEVGASVAAGETADEACRSVQMRDYRDVPRFAQAHGLNVRVVHAELSRGYERK